MTSLPDELRLLIFVVVQAFVLIAAWRFVSRFVASRVQRGIDALLLTYLIQYAAVGLPGMLGVLSPTAMLAVAAGIAVLLLVLTPSPGTPGEGGGEGSAANSQAAGKSKQNPHPNLLPGYREKEPENPPSRSWFGASGFQRLAILAGFLFVAGYVAAYIWQERYLPPLATDALTYHFPAAVQWLQRGRIDLFQTWFFNPANTYSPMAGSMFYAWLLGPIGNDTLAHFASAPMVLLIFLSVVALVRSVAQQPGGNASRSGTRCVPATGVQPPDHQTPIALAPDETSFSKPGAILTAVLAGLAVALSRPIVSQIDKGKDDLFLAAFFAVAAGALSPRRLRDPLGPWRLGAAIGLALAIKYTALLALPMLVLAIDAPFRAGWRWRQWGIAIGCVVATALPWYLRNLILSGNPLFPADFLGFHGLLSTARSSELGSFAGVMGVILSGPFAIPGALGGVMLLTWVAAVAFGTRRAMREPLVRLVLLGPVLGVGIFVFASPYPEIRFIVPAMMLLLATVGVLNSKWAWALAGAGAIAGIATGLSAELWQTLLTFCLTGVVFVGVGVPLFVLGGRWYRQRRDVLGLAICLALLLPAGYAYIMWRSFLSDRDVLATVAWADDGRDKLWTFVRNELPAGEPIAYTGTFTVYPLMGYHLDRPVMYVPVRPGVKTIADLPRIGDHLAGEQIQSAALAATVEHADREAWLANVRRSGIKHLVVFVSDVEKAPIELTWAKELPDHFKIEYMDGAGVVLSVTGW